MEGLKEALGAPATWGVVGIFDTLGKEERRAVESKDYITAVAIAIIASLGALALSIVNVFTTIGNSIYKEDIEILKKGVKAEGYLLAMIFAFPVFAVQVGLGNQQALPFPIGEKADLERDQEYSQEAMRSGDEKVRKEAEDQCVQAFLSMAKAWRLQEYKTYGRVENPLMARVRESMGDAEYVVAQGLVEGRSPWGGLEYYVDQEGGNSEEILGGKEGLIGGRAWLKENSRGLVEEVNSDEEGDGGVPANFSRAAVLPLPGDQGTHNRTNSQE